MQNHCLFSSNNIYFCQCQELIRKKSKEDEQTLEELNLVHRRSQAKCQLVPGVQTNYIKRIKLLLFSPYNKHLINRAKLVCMEESHYVRSVLTTSVKILPYRPPARFIRANYIRCMLLLFSCKVFNNLLVVNSI